MREGVLGRLRLRDGRDGEDLAELPPGGAEELARKLALVETARQHALGVAAVLGLENSMTRLWSPCASISTIESVEAPRHMPIARRGAGVSERISIYRLPYTETRFPGSRSPARG